MKNLLFLLLIALISCQKSTVTPNGATPPLTSSPTSHKIKYVIFTSTQQQCSGSYLDSAGRMVSFSNWDTKLDTIAIHPYILDSNGYHGLPGATYQIKIGNVDIEKGVYIKAGGGWPSQQHFNFEVAICKDTVMNGEACYVVKKYATRYPSGTIELSYIVK